MKHYIKFTTSIYLARSSFLAEEKKLYQHTYSHDFVVRFFFFSSSFSSLVPFAKNVFTQAYNGKLLEFQVGCLRNWEKWKIFRNSSYALWISYIFIHIWFIVFAKVVTACLTSKVKSKRDRINTICGRYEMFFFICMWKFRRVRKMIVFRFLIHLIWYILACANSLNGTKFIALSLYIKLLSTITSFFSFSFSFFTLDCTVHNIHINSSEKFSLFAFRISHNIMFLSYA